MKKYVKPFLLVLINNALLLMFLYMLIDYKFWGLVLILFIGFCWLISFSMLVVCVHCADLEKHNIKI